MKGGTFELFKESLARGMELEFKYGDKKYFVQGYHPSPTSPYTLSLEQIEPLNPDVSLEISDLYGFNANELLKTKFFAGKSLEEIEQNVEWTDG